MCTGVWCSMVISAHVLRTVLCTCVGRTAFRGGGVGGHSPPLYICCLPKLVSVYTLRVSERQDFLENGLKTSFYARSFKNFLKTTVTIPLTPLSHTYVASLPIIPPLPQSLYTYTLPYCVAPPKILGSIVCPLLAQSCM